MKWFITKLLGISSDVVDFVKEVKSSPENFYTKKNLVNNKFIIGYEVGTWEEGFILSNNLQDYRDVLKGKCHVLKGILHLGIFSLVIDKKNKQVYIFNYRLTGAEELTGIFKNLKKQDFKYIREEILQ